MSINGFPANDIKNAQISAIITKVPFESGSGRYNDESAGNITYIAAYSALYRKKQGASVIRKFFLCEEV